MDAVPCPVLANGNVYSADKAADVLAQTGARGLMIGRGAIRNPWLFEQIRQHERGEPLTRPRGRDVLGYVHALYEAANPYAGRARVIARPQDEALHEFPRPRRGCRPAVSCTTSAG